MKKSNIKRILSGISSVCVIASTIPVSGSSFAAAAADASDIVYGDANCDGSVDMSDAVLIMQSLSNPDKYGLNGSDASHITLDGLNFGDVYERGDGITNADALAIQRYKLNLIPSLPETWMNGNNPDDDKKNGTLIHLKGDSIEIEGDYAEVNGTTVTITHSGIFTINGTLNDGQINVAVPDETVDPETVKIFLNGVEITGKSAPAILISNAENTSINLVDGTVNTISDGDTAYAGDYLGNAVIEAKDDITIKGETLGTGILNLTANTQDGIVCNNDIKINGGNINVTTLNAADKTNAINGKTSVTIKSGILNVDAEGDGIKSSKGNVEISGGTSVIKAGNDAVQSGTTIDISGGVIIAGGDRGLTGGTGVNITGGSITATATDYQTDASLLTSSQNVLLFNCIDNASNTDGCWKKANSFNMPDASEEQKKFTKKYKYVLLSEAGNDTSFSFVNSATGARVTHSNDVSDVFTISGNITVFENVNPAGKTGTVIDPVAEGYTLTLSGSSMLTNAPSDTASVNDNVCTITKPGIFSITGENNGGQIVVDVDKTTYPDGVVELDLMGMSITNSNTAPIYVASIGNEVQIVAKSSTDNTISDGSSHTQTYTDSDGNVNTVEGAIFARDDIKFKGTGTLTVNGNTDDAVVSKNDIKIYNGNITVNAVDDGIRGKDSVIIGNANSADYSSLNLTVKTKGGDGIKSTSTDTSTETKSYGLVEINGGTIDINSYADGIQAEQDFVMNGGDLTVYTYQGSSFTSSGSSSSGGNPWGGGWGGGDGNSNKTDISAKGVKAVGIYDAAGTTWQSSGNITVNGGNINIDSSDDSIHCGGDMLLNGGILKLASADDAAHSDHNLTIGQSGADVFDDIQIFVSKAYEGIEAQNITQNSGTVIVNSTDDGYNAAGGADGSGSGNNMGWNPGNMGTNGGNYSINIKGGFALTNVADGDHDGFDSNGSLTISGGYAITNGNEPFDADGSLSCTGGVFIENTGSGGMQMGAGLSASVSASGSASTGTRITLVGGDNKVIVSFIAGKNVSQFKAGGTNVSGASFYTGGTLSGSTYFQTEDQNQLAAYGGSLSGGTQVSGSSSGNRPGF